MEAFFGFFGASAKEPGDISENRVTRLSGCATRMPPLRFSETPMNATSPAPAPPTGVSAVAVSPYAKAVVGFDAGWCQALRGAADAGTARR